MYIYNVNIVGYNIYKKYDYNLKLSKFLNVYFSIYFKIQIHLGLQPCKILKNKVIYLYARINNYI